MTFLSKVHCHDDNKVSEAICLGLQYSREIHPSVELRRLVVQAEDVCMCKYPTAGPSYRRKTAIISLLPTTWRLCGMRTL